MIAKRLTEKVFLYSESRKVVVLHLGGSPSTVGWVRLAAISIPEFAAQESEEKLESKTNKTAVQIARTVKAAVFDRVRTVFWVLALRFTEVLNNALPSR